VLLCSNSYAGMSALLKNREPCLNHCGNPNTQQRVLHTVNGFTCYMSELNSILLDEKMKAKMSKWPPLFLSSSVFKRMAHIENALNHSWKMKCNGPEWKFLNYTSTKSSHGMMDSCLFSFTQVGCQPEENEEDKSEKESDGHIHHPLEWEVGEEVCANRWG
jgi:hypothetical protein